MTLFDSYFATHIEPALQGAPPASVKLAKASAAEIWNAALSTIDAVTKVDFDFDGAKPAIVGADLRDRFLNKIKFLRVTP